MLLIPAALVVFAGTAHLRSGATREWSSFPETAAGRTLNVAFRSKSNLGEHSLLIRQRDVKNRNWAVRINGADLGVLLEDERRMICVLPIPPRLLRDGANNLEIAAGSGGVSDDIEVSNMETYDIPLESLLRQTTLDLATSNAQPVRFTIVDAAGWLMPFRSLRVAAVEAQRTGALYAGDGHGRIGLPAGAYRIYASRGLEYTAPSATVRLKAGDERSITLTPKREFSVDGYVSMDTHVHTREWSGHGDATVDERVVTAAGEGLDVIVATEHNRVGDYTKAIGARGLSAHLRSIPGNEVTTAMGHFNVFPALKLPSNTTEQNWSALMRSLDNAAVIQNHPRDLHSAYRPFDPEHHISIVGENLNGRPFQANAMEVVNSGAMASDPLQLVRDWMGLLTRGLTVAGIGASDTHTVDFVPIGQARTYVKTPHLAESIAAGNTLVSYGLVVTLRQSSSVRSKTVAVQAAIHAPSWSGADAITIFSNGIPVWHTKLKRTHSLLRSVNVPIPRHDTTLVAVATGGGVMQPFWEVRKPYQPTSATWSPLVLGVSSAIRIDVDRDGKHTSPLEYARVALRDGQLFAQYDDSVVAHAANLLYLQGADLNGDETRKKLGARDGFRQYLLQKDLASK